MKKTITIFAVFVTILFLGTISIQALSIESEINYNLSEKLIDRIFIRGSINKLEKNENFTNFTAKNIKYLRIFKFENKYKFEICRLKNIELSYDIGWYRFNGFMTNNFIWGVFSNKYSPL